MTKRELATAPTVEPVSLDELREHIRYPEDVHDEDEYLDGLIATARAMIERETWRALCTQTWDFCFDKFEDPLTLPYPPLSSVSAITYVDNDGATQTLGTSVYETGEVNGIGVVRRKYNQSWPSIRSHEDVVKVTAVCGYGVASSVPMPLRQACKLLAAHLYEVREPVQEKGARGGSFEEVPYTIQTIVLSYSAKGFR